MLHLNTNFQLWFFRHGESETNLTPGVVAGKSPHSPLTSRGEKQATALGKRLNLEKISFEKAFSSTCLRAFQTGTLALKECEIKQPDLIQVPQLDEISQGDWEGKIRDEVYNAENLGRMFKKGLSFTPPNGEGVRAVERRVSHWLEDEILYNPQLTCQKKPLHFAFFTHGMTIRALLHFILGCDEKIVYRFMVQNTALFRFNFDRDGWGPLELNDYSHLKEVGVISHFFSH